MGFELHSLWATWTLSCLANELLNCCNYSSHMVLWTHCCGHLKLWHFVVKVIYEYMFNMRTHTRFWIYICLHLVGSKFTNFQDKIFTLVVYFQFACVTCQLISLLPRPVESLLKKSRLWILAQKNLLSAQQKDHKTGKFRMYFACSKYASYEHTLLASVISFNTMLHN